MPVDTALATNPGVRGDESTTFQLRRFAVFSDVADAVTLLVSHSVPYISKQSALGI